MEGPPEHAIRPAAVEGVAARADPVVRVGGVTRRFGAVTALADVSIDIPPGHFVTLLGPSGCGKSTLLRIIAGFDSADEGTVEIGGRDMRRIPPERRPVNLVFQRYALFPHLNVLDNVLFGPEAAGVPRRDAVGRAHDALSRCRIAELADRRIHELSGGQAQRVAVARAIVNRPAVLLLDEPLAALDLNLRRHLQFELRRLQQELQTTFVYVTHDQGEALAMSDTVALMHAGRVVQLSAPRALYDEPVSVFAATFIGEANVLACQVEQADAATALVRLAGGGQVRTRIGPRPIAAGHQAYLCIRPERVRLRPAGGGEPAVATGHVRDMTFEGAAVRYWLRVDDTDTELVVTAPAVPGAPLYAVGDRLAADWNEADGVVLAD